MDIGEEELIRSEQVKIVYVSSLPYLMQQQMYIVIGGRQYDLLTVSLVLYYVR